MKDQIIALACAAALAVIAAGCYIGRASFEGENMQMYPFFGTAAETSAAAPTGEALP